jgi:stage II sporulation protein D
VSWNRIFIYLIIVLSVFLPPSLCAAAGQQETIRILIDSYAKPFSLSGLGLQIRDLDNPGQPVFSARHNPLIVNKKANGIKVNDFYLKGQRFSITSADKYIAIDGQMHCGSIIMYPGDNKDILVINEINIDKYLEGLISIELSPKWELTAMKVQAVIARSYALYQKQANLDKPYHLTSTVAHQLYKGIEHANAKTKQAVFETRGEVLTYGGQPVMAVYHSCCGGRTENAHDVWSSNQPYLKSVFCGACSGYDKYFWKITVPRGTLYKKLRQAGYADTGGLESVAITKRSRTNRMQEITFSGKRGSVVLPGNEFRSVLGFSDMRSTNFIVRESADRGYIEFLGTGFGHAVGLCQWGARARAQHGETYRDILQYYYPGTTLQKLY